MFTNILKIDVCQEDGVRHFSGMPRDRTRGNKHELKHGKFHLNLRKSFFTLKETALEQTT